MNPVVAAGAALAIGSSYAVIYAWVRPRLIARRSHRRAALGHARESHRGELRVDQGRHDLGHARRASGAGGAAFERDRGRGDPQHGHGELAEVRARVHRRGRIGRDRSLDRACGRIRTVVARARLPRVCGVSTTAAGAIGVRGGCAHPFRRRGLRAPCRRLAGRASARGSRGVRARRRAVAAPATPRNRPRRCVVSALGGARGRSQRRFSATARRSVDRARRVERLGQDDVGESPARCVGARRGTNTHRRYSARRSQPASVVDRRRSRAAAHRAARRDRCREHRVRSLSGRHRPRPCPRGGA